MKQKLVRPKVTASQDLLGRQFRKWLKYFFLYLAGIYKNLTDIHMPKLLKKKKRRIHKSIVAMLLKRQQ